MKKYTSLLCALVCCLLLAPVQAQSTSQPEPDTWVVGTKIAPPFVVKNDAGELEGISIALWKQIAAEEGINYRFEETSLEGLLTGLNNGRFDASVAALTVNAQREQSIDFTHPFYTTGLAIAVPHEQGRLMTAISGFFSWEFFAALSGLCLLLLAVGALLWLFERKRNAEMFGGSTAQGLGASFWWAAVTMTTVGYGDKAPTTLGGRIIGFFWMFAAIIIISSFTAAIATSLTVSQLDSSVQGVEDLPDVRVGTLENSASADFLTAHDIRYRKVASLEKGLTALENGSLDALVYDKPILQYLVSNDDASGVRILPEVIERQDYAIALPEDSTQRERLNTTLLKAIESSEWEDTLETYLGK
ncbi:transporter substrate-binding domain-containing protein [Alteromonas sp. ASW11-19]|uniref:Transporter substrate-binding domain-containing protein n=1 Tax=Alteromonas salexigens TaxID=2982530 RepID=A0ABT2VRB8_9ALTE|nr:transporter substrate-binding domain-containing protein [Alteromonas salexigens]MCU7554953.1 transporter substrate-binding domain-containing protein [Alteromonas salexigens]